jgi:hypothetical protein
MQANRSDATPETPCRLEAYRDDQQIAAGAILGLLLDGDYHGPWTVADIKSWLSSPDAAIEEALIDLRSAGLIYAREGIVFARLAARTMDRLDL